MWVVALLLYIVSVNCFAEDLHVKIDRVYDGDTAMFSMPNMPPHLAKMSVRLVGIDTAEMRSRCQSEKTLATNAKQFLKNEIEGKLVTLSGCNWDKYGGRLDCVVFKDGQNINQKMINNRLAVPYNGGKKLTNWCAM